VVLEVEEGAKNTKGDMANPQTTLGVGFGGFENEGKRKSKGGAWKTADRPEQKGSK